MSAKIVVVFDKSSLSNYGICSIISSNISEVSVISVDSEKMLAETLKEKAVDLLVLSTGSGLNLSDTLKALKKDATVVVYYEDFEAALFVKKSFYNVKGLISKMIDPDSFIRSIKSLLLSKQVLCYITQDLVMAALSPGGQSGKGNFNIKDREDISSFLSRREFEIFNLMKLNKRTSEISNELNLKPSTVSTIKASILRKFKLNNVID